MKRSLRVLMILVCVLSLSVAVAFGQTAQGTPPGVVLKLQVTVSRYMGTNRVSSQPYVLSLVPNESGNIRLGVEVPVPAAYTTPLRAAMPPPQQIPSPRIRCNKWELR